MSAGKGRAMKKSLNSCIVPALHERGFAGEFPVLRRVRNEGIDIIELQFSKYGGGFRLNLAVCASEKAKFVLEQPGSFVPMNVMARTYFLTPFNASAGKIEARWFEFSNENTDNVAQAILPFVEIINQWFLTGIGPRSKSKSKSRPGPIHRFVMRLLRPR